MYTVIKYLLLFSGTAILAPRFSLTVWDMTQLIVASLCVAFYGVIQGRDS